MHVQLFLASSNVEFSYAITNCLLGSAFENENSSLILKYFLKHQNSRKLPKKLKDFPKKLKADPKKLKEKLGKLKNPPTGVEMGWQILAKKSLA